MRRAILASIAGLLCSAATVALAQVAAPAGADSKPADGEFLRIAKNDAGAPVTLQASIVRFVPAADSGPTGLTVDLVSAIHIADARFYQELNDRFRDYDTVL